MSKNCFTCGNALFDKVWGEYRCTKSQCYVEPERIEDCTGYKKGEPGEAKGVTDDV